MRQASCRRQNVASCVADLDIFSVMNCLAHPTGKSQKPMVCGFFFALIAMNIFTRRIEFREHGQAVAMKHYGWGKQDFIERFGKNYL